jgi:L-threonylcarbamoyladenylate synthase
LTLVLPMGRPSYSRAAKIVREGGLVVYPTDTVYGLGCDPFNAAAVQRLFEAKARSAKPVSVLCSSRAKAQELVTMSPTARKLVSEHWPGALTLVAPTRRRLPAQLTQGGTTLGVRVPDHEGCLQLIRACGGWLTGTSANISGTGSARSASGVLKQLGASVDLILDGGELEGRESTVVRVIGTEVAILRTGPIGVGVEATGP